MQAVALHVSEGIQCLMKAVALHVIEVNTYAPRQDSREQILYEKERTMFSFLNISKTCMNSNRFTYMLDTFIGGIPHAVKMRSAHYSACTSTVYSIIQSQPSHGGVRSLQAQYFHLTSGSCSSFFYQYTNIPL